MMRAMLISPAYAQAAAAAPQGDIFSFLLPIVLMFGVFWLLVFRPQQKKIKQHKEMITNLKRGDQVLTGGGSVTANLIVAADGRGRAAERAADLRREYARSDVRPDPGRCGIPDPRVARCHRGGVPTGVCGRDWPRTRPQPGDDRAGPRGARSRCVADGG